MFKSSMKEEDIKALVNAVKNEFQQEITSLNEKIKHLEHQNLNLNTFIQHHFERLDRKTDENHQYILNQWNPFMQSTIESVKNDLIETMNNNKKDDVELSKRVDTLAIQVSDLNKAVFDEDPLLGYVLVGISNNKKNIFADKNVNTFDQITGYFETSIANYDSNPRVFFLESLSRFKNIKTFKFMYITAFNYDIMYKNKLLYNRTIYGEQQIPYNDEKTKNIIKNYCKTLDVEFICE